MDLMSSRWKSFGFRKRDSSSNHPKSPSPTTTVQPPQIPNPSTHTLVAPPTANGATSPSSPPSHTSSSSTSLPMNPQQQQNALGRPPSYPYGRATSPLPPTQLASHPPPLNTNMQYTQPAVQHVGAPPGYGIQQPLAPPSVPPSMPQPQYLRNPAVEVEGSNRSKAQLIVGIDFGTTFSGVAFAFATNNEAREDIITEWPGSGTHTKQKVCFVHVGVAR